MSEISGTEAVLRIVSGHPDAAELAALTAVLAAVSAASGAPSEHPQPVGGWGDPAALLRGPRTPGPGAWRSSAWT